MDEEYEITIVSYENDNKESKLIGIPLSQPEILNYIQDVETIKNNPGKKIFLDFFTHVYSLHVYVQYVLTTR